MKTPAKLRSLGEFEYGAGRETEYVERSAGGVRLRLSCALRKSYGDARYRVLVVDEVERDFRSVYLGPDPSTAYDVYVAVARLMGSPVESRRGVRLRDKTLPFGVVELAAMFLRPPLALAVAVSEAESLGLSMRYFVAGSQGQQIMMVGIDGAHETVELASRRLSDAAGGDAMWADERVAIVVARVA